MPITDKQLEARKSHIGASEAAAILGLSPWRTAYDIYLEKTGKVELPASAGEAADIGNMVESSLLDWAAIELGRVKILKNQFRVHEGGILSATHDALIVDKPEGLEAKTAGIMNPFSAKDQWGEDGTDQIPEHILIQCQQQALVSKLDMVHVPTLLGGRGRVIYHIERSAALCEIILERVTAFWENNVLKDIPPEGLPTLNVIRYRVRQPGLVVPIPAELVLNWQAIQEERKVLEQSEDQAKAAVLAIMGDAETGESEVGSVRVQKIMSERFDTKALKAAYPDMAALYVKELETVRVTFSKAKLLTK